MELIPILSLIILVATISTFILAVGAYILYKVREKKGKVASAPQPATVAAEFITPAPLYGEQTVPAPQVGGPRRTVSEVPMQREAAEYQQPAFVPQQERMQSGPELKPTYVNSSPSITESRYQRPSTETRSEPEKTQKQKMMRYTSDGYTEPIKEEKKEDSLKWR